MLKAGAIVADKYRIEHVLGKGGMGAVYAARHNQLGTHVALKFLHDTMTGHPKIVERFLREARSSASLRGEHICRVSDVGTSDGVPFIVMELLEGTDLAKLLKRETRLTSERACDFVLQACAGIAEAHAVGIVHRDLKPGNLFLTTRPDGSPLLKVLDFGIAKAPVEPGFDLTQTTTVLGSPGYMSPEQLRSSKIVDARADIWALGAILFELLTGRPPFTADALTELALKIAVDPTPTLPGENAELDRVIGRCLEKEPQQRFANVGELAESLSPFASADQRVSASVVKGVLRSSEPRVEVPTPRMRPNGMSPEQVAAAAAVTQATPDPDDVDSVASTSQTSATTLGRATGEVDGDHARRMRWPWLVAFGLAVAGGTAFGVYMLGGRSEPPLPRAAATAVDREAPPIDAARPANPVATPGPSPTTATTAPPTPTPKPTPTPTPTPKPTPKPLIDVPSTRDHAVTVRKPPHPPLGPSHANGSATTTAPVGSDDPYGDLRH